MSFDLTLNQESVTTIDADLTIKLAINIATYYHTWGVRTPMEAEAAELAIRILDGAGISGFLLDQTDPTNDAKDEPWYQSAINEWNSK